MDKGMEKFEFVHFRWPQIGPSAGATVVICRDKEFIVKCASMDSDLVASVGLCSPCEDNFSKRQGRKAAVRRLCHKERRESFYVVGDNTYENDCGETMWFTNKEIAEDVLMKYFISPIAPLWFTENMKLVDNKVICKWSTDGEVK